MNLLEQLSQTRTQLTPDPPKSRQTLFLRAFDRRWIVETPVYLFRAARKNGAAGFGIVTNRNHVIEVLVYKLINRFRAVPRYVDAQLPHHSDRLRPHFGRPGPGAEHLETIARIVPQQPLSHLTAG